MNNIDCVTQEKSKCFGCRACANICPRKAIVMKQDDEGFFYPVIDENKCINCGLCKKVCPALNKSKLFEGNTENPECYAVMANDDIRAVSSSGGAFSLIANEIFKRGGVVAGVAYVGQKVQHIIIDNPDDLYKLRGSKYVQSDTNTIYSQIKDILKTGRWVLFTGTPCQCAGLNTFLGETYDNLITVDVLCHGVPPQRVFDKYLEETIGDEKFVNADFRDKRQGWTVYLSVKTNKAEHNGRQKIDNYLNAFLKNMCLRPSCEKCPFTKKNRDSDFTIGDYWAVGRYDKNLNDEKGTSVVIVHNEKAKQFFDIIMNEAKVCVKTPLEYAAWYNITLYTPLKQYPNRQAFFKLLNNGKSLKETVRYCLDNPYDCLLMTTINYPNYGGVMTSYALGEAIKKLGYNPVYIRNRLSDNIYLNNFINRHINLTPEDLSTPAKINKYSQTVIVGSDCNWAPFFHGKNLDFLLDWATPSSKKISFSTSFGLDSFVNSGYERDENLRLQYKYYLSQFDNISVREDSGVDILKNEFDISGEQCIDPVFLLNKEYYYDKLIKPYANNQNTKALLTSYYFAPKESDKKILAETATKLNLDLKTFEKDVNTDIENWLSGIYYSDFFISNSFHGICFAIIFNKNFICIENKTIGKNRMLSLLRKLGLEHRMIKDLREIESRPDLFEPIDWEKANAILDKEKKRSLKWLKDAMETPKDLSKINPTDVVIQSLNNRICCLESSLREDMRNALHFKKIYVQYIKYRILKNFVFGAKRKKYRQKQKKLHEKIRSAKKIIK